MLDNGELRTGVPGQFQRTLGVSVIGDTVYTSHTSGIVALSSIAWGDKLVLMSAFDGDIVLWDPVANTPLERSLLPGPVDAGQRDRRVLIAIVPDSAQARSDRTAAVRSSGPQ